MPIDLPLVVSPIVNPKTGLINPEWYLALLGLTDAVTGVAVTSVNIAGNNGITVVGSPITSASIITLGINNLTCASAVIAGTVTAANAVITGAVLAANMSATATITAANVVVSANLSAANIAATGTVTAASAIVTGTITAGNVRATGFLGTGTVTAVNVILSGTISAASVVANSFITTPRTYVSNFTRDMSTASGNQAVTGVGFTPKAVIFFGSVVNGLANDSSKGFSDGTRNFCLLDYTTSGANWATTFLTANCIYLFDDVGTANTNSATIASLDSDGFTVAWVRGGAPTSTMTIGFMAIG